MPIEYRSISVNVKSTGTNEVVTPTGGEGETVYESFDVPPSVFFAGLGALYGARIEVDTDAAHEGFDSPVEAAFHKEVKRVCELVYGNAISVAGTEYNLTRCRINGSEPKGGNPPICRINGTRLYAHLFWSESSSEESSSEGKLCRTNWPQGDDAEASLVWNISVLK